MIKGTDLVWTNDCQGKQDFDGSLVSVSSRYWPRGGGMTIYNAERHEFVPTDNSIKPAAVSSILVGYTKVADFKCEGETEEEVKAKVEEWVQNHFTKISVMLMAYFG